MDIIEAIFELVFSSRFFLGIGVTIAVCWILVSVVPGGTLGWGLAIPAAILGVGLSFWWEIRRGAR